MPTRARPVRARPRRDREGRLRSRAGPWPSIRPRHASRRTRSSCSSSSRKSGSIARLDGTLPEKPGAEGVDRTDEDPLETGQGGVEPVPDLPVLRREPGPFQRDLEPPAELGRRLAGEGDGGQRVDLGPARGEQGDHPVDQALRLARAGPGLDEERRIEIVPDPVAWRPGRAGALFFTLITCTRRACRRPRRPPGSPPSSGRTSWARRHRRPTCNRSTCTWLPVRR